eukprot:scaffold146101_cov34-Tisochrysis_lutea.AAC.4
MPLSVSIAQPERSSEVRDVEMAASEMSPLSLMSHQLSSRESAASPASETSRHPFKESFCSCGRAAPIRAMWISCTASHPDRLRSVSDLKHSHSTRTSRPSASEPQSERLERVGVRRLKARSALLSGVPRSETRVICKASCGGRKSMLHSRQTKSSARTSEKGRNEAMWAR